METSVDDLRLYTRCSLAWFFEKRAGVARPRGAADLVAEALSAALARYYTGQAHGLSAAVGQVWQAWCAGWGEPAVFGELVRYARDRATILAQFEKGAFRKADGGLYAVPQMTAKYRDLMHTRGLTAIGRTMDEFAVQRGVQLDAADDEHGGRVGGALADAFAEALTAAERMSHHETQPLPAKEVVLGLQIPYAVELNARLRLTGTADLVCQAAGDGGAAILEVHDCESQPFMRAGLAARDLRVLAVALAQPASDDLTWDRVERVVYRHWLSGETYVFQEGNFGHLLAVVASAMRGMQHQVVAPRALVGYDACRACGYRVQCWSETGWSSLPLLDPGRLEYAEHLRAVIGQLKVAGDNGEARRRLGQALDVLEAEFVQLDPNLADMLTLTRAAKAVVGNGEEVHK